MKEKQKLIADLYALRAGLSLISVCAEELKETESELEEQGDFSQFERKIDEVKKKESSLDEKIAEEKSKFAKEFGEEFDCVKKNAQDTYGRRIKSYEEDLIKYEEYKKMIPNEQKLYKFKEFCSAFLVYEVIVGIFSLLLYWVFKSWLPFLILSVLAFIVAKGVVGHVPLKPKFHIKEKYKGTYYKIEDLITEKLDLQKELERIEEEKIEKERIYNTEQYPILMDKQKAISQKSFSIKSSLNNIYDDVVSEKDWGNIDLLIYALETGRAGNIKEALLWVDGERRTNRIVVAIDDASRNISQTIKGTVERLGIYLSDSLDMIGKRMVKMERSQRAMVSELSDMVSSQIESSEMQNALLGKISTTNETLLSDLRYNQKFWIK